MALGVLPLDGGRIELVESAPQVLVEHGFFGGRAPASILPAVNPLGNALAQVLAVRNERDSDVGWDGAETFDGCLQLHAIVGRLWDKAAQFHDAAIAVEQPRCPAAWSWVERTGTVGENGHGLRGIGLLL